MEIKRRTKVQRHEGERNGGAGGQTCEVKLGANDGTNAGVDDSDDNSGKDIRETSNGKQAPRQYYIIRYLQIQVNMISDSSYCSLLEIASANMLSYISSQIFLKCWPSIYTHTDFVSVGGMRIRMGSGYP
jgi:hypothetical protein